MTISASGHSQGRLAEKHQEYACSMSLVSVLNKKLAEIFQKQKSSGKYAVLKTIFTLLFSCATANQYVTPTRTEKTPAWEPKVSQFHIGLQNAECFNTDILES